MSTDDLIRENEELKRKLGICRAWMRRQIEESMYAISRDSISRKTRNKYTNDMEADQIHAIQSRIATYFAEDIAYAPAHTVDRLIDAEIYWYTLQKHPTIDALPVVLSYQKILDSYIEDNIVSGFRTYSTQYIHTLPVPTSGIERDIEKILMKNYTLSIGRMYQMLQHIRTSDTQSQYIQIFSTYLQDTLPSMYSLLVSDDFFVRMQALVEMDIWGEKRHKWKVSYIDAKRARTILVGDYVQVGILVEIFGVGE